MADRFSIASLIRFQFPLVKVPAVYRLFSVSLMTVCMFAVAVGAEVHVGHDGEHAADVAGDGVAGGHDAHADEAGTPPLLQFDLGSAICNLLIFLGVFAVLAKFVWPPILDGLKAREQKIHGDLVAAQAANDNAAAMLADYKLKLAEASTEVQAMLAEARKDGEASAARIVAEAKAEGDRQRVRAMSDIESAKRIALADLANQTSAMAIGVASQVIGRELRPEDHSELIRSSLDRLPSNN